MVDQHRLSIKLVGENGQGLTSMGELLGRAFKREGCYTFSYREYPSLIEGGKASHQIDLSDRPIYSSAGGCDILLSLSRFSLHHYLKTVNPGGRILHDIPRLDLKPDEKQWLDENRITVEFVDALQVSIEVCGKRIMANTVLMGALWQVLGLNLATIKQVLTKVFAAKPQVLEGNFVCAQRGFEQKLTQVTPVVWPFARSANTQDDAIISGNHLTALGAAAAGVRAYYSYPMTPASTILTYLAEVAGEVGMLVQQLDDEIGVAQTTIGSMFMGARTLCGTSGGGFDLMTESLSLAGMIECPWVCVLAQRPGPATGLPTWTSAADLNLAIYSGHGEFARLVLAASDGESSYRLVQHALNLAEKYQLPAVLLTEKNVAESLWQMSKIPDNLPIERGLVPDNQLDQLKPSDRYAFTDSGVSPRWLPGQADATYDANGDEHSTDGSITEDGAASAAMYAKRLRKLDALAAELPEPVVYGPEQAQWSLVGWGSVKGPVLDAIQALAEQGGPSVNYLHYEYLWPLKTMVLKKFAQSAQKLIIVENNATGQLGGLITQHTGITFTDRWLKFDGRPFFVDDILEHFNKESA